MPAKNRGGLGMALELGRQSCRSVNLSHDNLNYANVTPSAIKERPPPSDCMLGDEEDSDGIAK